jgi:hypothetical protein
MNRRLHYVGECRHCPDRVVMVRGRWVHLSPAGKPTFVLCRYRDTNAEANR